MPGQPLRRTTDDLEQIGRRACRTLALLGIPFAVMFGWLSHQAATETADGYAASLHRAEAITLEDAPDLPVIGARPPPTVAAEWTGADRVVHRGQVQVPAGSEAGYEIRIWTTETGEAATGPPSRAQLVIDAALLALEIVLGFAAVAFVAFHLLRRGLDRRRSREWDRAWETFDAGQRRL